MAKKNRVDLNAVIQYNLPDNTTDFITPALDREVEIDEIDSCFNLEDDTAFDVNYTPTTVADWDVTPTEVAGSLDELAGRVKTIENSLPIVKIFEFFFNTSSPTSNEVPSYGTVDIFGTERQDGSITSVEYETSTDKINWTNRGNLAGLDAFMIGATSTTFLWIRAVNPVVTGLGEKGFIVQYN